MSGGEPFHEIYLDAGASSLPAGARIGPAVVLPYLMPISPESGKLVRGDMEAQLRVVFASMDRALAAAGCGRGDVARVTLFMSQTSDRTAMNAVFKHWYPDEDARPPHKYVPAKLPAGMAVAAQVIAVPGGVSRAVEVPGIHHGDWMSLGGVCANLVTSSRIFGTDPETGRGSNDAAPHTGIVFANADRLLALSGGGWLDLTQATVFYEGESLRDVILEEWRSREKRDDAALHLIETDLGGQSRDGRLLPRLEIIAVL